MNEMLIPICLKVPTAAPANVVAGFEVPFNCTLVGVSASLDAVTGGPSAVTYDINDDGTVLTDYTAVAIGTTAGAVTSTKSKHLGGTIDPVEIAKDSEVDIDINITGGASPTAGVSFVLWVLKGEA